MSKVSDPQLYLADLNSFTVTQLLHKHGNPMQPKFRPLTTALAFVSFEKPDLILGLKG
jgi:Tol biopolymer transport system component